MAVTAEAVVSILGVLRDSISPGLTKISGKVGELQSRLHSLGTTVEPITGKLVEFASAFIGLAAAAKAIGGAEEQVRAERGLLGALQGRLAALQDIDKATKDLQESTGIEHTVLLKVAQQFAAIGVNAQDIPRALVIAVDLAERFGLSVEEVATNIAIISQGGQSRGLNRLIPKLKELTDAGATTAEVFNLLEQRSKGAAAEFAKTDFGKVRIQLADLTEQANRVGIVLVKLKEKILEGLVDVVHRLADALSSPAFATAIEVVGRLAPTIVTLVSAFAGLAALGAVARTLAPIVTILIRVVTVIGSLVSVVVAAVAALNPFTVVVVAAGAVVAGFIAWFSGLDTVVGKVSKAIEAFGGEFFKVIKQINEGKLSTDSLFNLIKTRVAQAVEIIKFLGTSIFEIGKATFDTFVAIGGLIAGEIAAAVLKTVDLLQHVLTTLLQIALTPFEVALNGLIDGINAVSKAVGKNLDIARVSLTNVVPKQFVELTNAIATFTDANDVAIADIRDGFPKAFESIAAAWIKMSSTIERGEHDMALARAEDAKKIVEDAIKAANASIDVEKKKQAEILRLFEENKQKADALAAVSQKAESPGSLFGITIEQARPLLAGLSAETKAAFRDLLVKEFNDQFDRGVLSARKLIEIRRELEISFLNEQTQRLIEQIAIQESLVKKSQERIGSTQTDLEGAKSQLELAKAMGAQREVILGLDRGIAAIETKLTGLVGDESDSQRQILDLEARRNKLAQERSDKAVTLRSDEKKLADDIISLSTREVRAQEILATQTSEALAAGTIGFQRALDLTEISLQSIDVAIAKAEGDLNDLLQERPTGEPGLVADIQRLSEQLDILQGKKVQIKVGIAKDIGDKATAASDEFNRKLEEAQAKASVGLISSSKEIATEKAALEDFTFQVNDAEQALLAFAAAHPEAVAAAKTLREEIDKLKAVIAVKGQELNTSDFFGGLSAGFQQATKDAETLKGAGEEIGQTLAGSIDAFSQALVRGQLDVRQFFGELLAQIAAAIVKMLILKTLASGIGLFSSATAAPLSIGESNLLAAGGPVPGPSVDRDVVPAMLTPGEFVHPTESVDYYGAAIMEAMRRRLIPKSLFKGLHLGIPSLDLKTAFATGGAVAGGTRGNAAPTEGFLVSSDRNASRFLSGGRGGVLRWLRQEKSDIKSALGI